MDLAETPRTSVSLHAWFSFLGVEASRGWQKEEGEGCELPAEPTNGWGLQPDPEREEGLFDSHHVQLWPARAYSKGTTAQIAVVRSEFYEINATARHYSVKTMKCWSVTIVLMREKCFLHPAQCHNHCDYAWTSLTYWPGLKKKRQQQTISLFSWVDFLSFPLPKFSWHKEDSRGPRLGKGPAPCIASRILGWLQGQTVTSHRLFPCSVWRSQVPNLVSPNTQVYISNAPPQVRDLALGVPAQSLDRQESFS